MSLKHISWLPAVIMMILIYSFSAKPAVESNESSLTIANDLLSVYEKVSDNRLEAENRLNVLKILNYVVRKGAHFTEYAILAAAFMLYFLLTKQRKRLIILLSVAFAAIYAVSDEIHQLFIPGRSGQIKDVLIDTAGAVMGASVFYFLTVLVNRANKKKKTL
jgi:VanZ family protein